MHSALHDRIEFGEASERVGVDNMFRDRGFRDFGGAEGCFRFSGLSDRISSDRRSKSCGEQREAHRPDGQELKNGCGGAARRRRLREIQRRKSEAW